MAEIRHTRGLRAVIAFFVAVFLPVMLSGCAVMDHWLAGSVQPRQGSAELPGLSRDARILRDELGIPVVEAENMDDLLYATGYAMASDRLAQMVTYCLAGQGRLAEMAGKQGLDMDIFIRSMGLPEAARRHYKELSPEKKRMHERFSEGVNAYMEHHKDSLPLDFRLAGYSPEPWEPVNSIYIFNVLNLGLSFNLSEEIAFLNLAAALGPRKAAWLFPVYPDEPLPFEKAEKISEAELFKMEKTLGRVSEAAGRIEQMLGPMGTAASNNWAVAPERTEKGASIICNDTHLPLEHPPIWMLMQVKAPDFHVAGVAMPGIPVVVAGYNGKIAWGMTMVMGDTQDIFLEKIKKIDGRDHYLYKGRWLPVEPRTETFHVKGGETVEKTIKSTRHGPLLNDALHQDSSDPEMPPAADSDFGLALSTAMTAADSTVEGIYGLHQAEDMEDAEKSIDKIGLMGLNFVYGDKNNIAWQVSGRYPVRRNGRGHLPSPGWTGDFDWEGFVSDDRLPHVLNPERGYLYTANHRTIDPRQGPVLGSSWYAPERAARIRQMLEENTSFNSGHAIDMQNDRTDLLTAKMKNLFFGSPLADRIDEAIDSWEDRKKAARARRALEIFREFDGKMEAESSGAALTGIFHHVFTRNLFYDELQRAGGRAEESFAVLNRGVYGPAQDHLTGRAMSPFWNDVGNPGKTETKAEIIARSLADAAEYAEDAMGPDPDDWQWGSIHTYEWKTRISKMRDQMPVARRLGAGMVSRYTDRGPYPAGGGFNTINVAGYHKGSDFDVWLVPAMRMVVDFARDEPLFLVNSGGQSECPASPHYDDGIEVWLKGENRQMSYKEQNLYRQYSKVFNLKAVNEN